MKSLTAVAVVLLVSAPGLPTLAQVTFAALPAPADIAAVYPAKASDEHLGGRAVISCVVTAAAALADCQVTSETPEGYGFGAAALAVAGKFKLNAANLPPRISIPLRFEPPAPEIRMAEPTFRTPKGYEEFGVAGPYYPDRAVRNGVQGLAILQCHLAASGKLTACRAVAETPPGQAFAEAALTMASRGVITAAPRMVDGVPLADEVVGIRVPFEITRRR